MLKLMILILKIYNLYQLRGKVRSEIIVKINKIFKINKILGISINDHNYLVYKHSEQITEGGRGRKKRKVTKKKQSVM